MATVRYLAALAVLACACHDHSTDPTPEPAESFANLPYGTDPAQVMDVVLPAGRTSATPVLVFIHGGAWIGGDKSIFTSTDLTRFSDHGYATVNINYRLVTPNIHDPSPSEDVTAALDFIAAHAGEYHVNPARFGLVGHSAGAHLALLASYRYDPTHRIKAVASLSGPTDLTDPVFLGILSTRQVLEEYLGVTQEAHPERWTGASPVSVATASAAPTIIVHGKVDVLVPYQSQAERLHLRLVALQVPDEYDLFPNYNHDLGYVALNHFPDAVWDPVLAWFERWVK
jgi:acetyl esterase/lipase